MCSPLSPGGTSAFICFERALGGAWWLRLSAVWQQRAVTSQWPPELRGCGAWQLPRQPSPRIRPDAAPDSVPMTAKTRCLIDPQWLRSAAHLLPPRAVKQVQMYLGKLAPCPFINRLTHSHRGAALILYLFPSDVLQPNKPQQYVGLWRRNSNAAHPRSLLVRTSISVGLESENGWGLWVSVGWHDNRAPEIEYNICSVNNWIWTPY